MGKQDVSSSIPNGFSSKDQWTLLINDAEYSSYSVLALSPCHKMIAFGNLKGKIKLQDVGERQPPVISMLKLKSGHVPPTKLVGLHQLSNQLFVLPADFNYPSVELHAYTGKVHNLLWSQLHSPQHLFSCGPDGQVTWWNIRHNEGKPTFNVTPLYSFILPPSKQRWASAIEIFLHPIMKEFTSRESWIKDAVVVCGDRKGSLHLFDPKNMIGSSQEASYYLCFKDIFNPNTQFPKLS